jgi:hypothetical protein
MTIEEQLRLAHAREKILLQALLKVQEALAFPPGFDRLKVEIALSDMRAQVLALGSKEGQA